MEPAGRVAGKHLRRAAVRSHGEAGGQRDQSHTGSRGCLLRRWGRSRVRPARTIHHGRNRTERQREPARRGGRHVASEPEQGGFRRAASDDLLQRGEEHRGDRPRHARRPGTVRVGGSARPGPPNRRGDRARAAGRYRHAEVLPHRHADLHVHPQRLGGREARRDHRHQLAALERAAQRLRQGVHPRCSHLLRSREGR